MSKVIKILRTLRFLSISGKHQLFNTFLTFSNSLNHINNISEVKGSCGNFDILYLFGEANENLEVKKTRKTYQNVHKRIHHDGENRHDRKKNIFDPEEKKVLLKALMIFLSIYLIYVVLLLKIQSVRNSFYILWSSHHDLFESLKNSHDEPEKFRNIWLLLMEIQKNLKCRTEESPFLVFSKNIEKQLVNFRNNKGEKLRKLVSYQQIKEFPEKNDSESNIFSLRFVNLSPIEWNNFDSFLKEKKETLGEYKELAGEIELFRSSCAYLRKNRRLFWIAAMPVFSSFCDVYRYQKEKDKKKYS